MTSDSDLLQQYVEASSQEAFAELVRRHVDLVYSSARRQLRSIDLAKDVTQTVFIKLSRQAAELKPGTLLGPWLYVVTRGTAVDLIRQEQRRRTREKIAHEIAAMKTPDAGWSDLEPVLEEAMESLDPQDRSALLLRFFEAKSLRDVGQAMNLSEDAAQNRVGRALTALQGFFSKRGIVTAAGALAANLSAHAVQTAPASWSTTLSTSILSGAGAAASPLGHTLFITTVQKTALAVAVVVSASLGLYKARTYYKGKAEIASLQRQSEALQRELQQTRAHREASAVELAQVEQQIDARLANARPPASGSDAAAEAEIRTLYTRVDRLRQFLKERPSLNIPELQLIGENSWITAVVGNELESDERIRHTLASLRSQASNAMASELQKALSSYLKTHEDNLPGSPTELAPFLDPNIDAATLNRYEMLQSGKADDLPFKNQLSVMAVKSPADVEYDNFSTLGVRGASMTTALRYDVTHAQEAFAEDHNGQKTADAQQLSPYLRWPVEPSVLQRYLASNSNVKRP